MTRKDYQLIADAIERSKLEGTTARANAQMQAQHRATARTVADRLREDNPDFDRSRFLRACGFDVPEQG